jgi:hypothetical protein
MERLRMRDEGEFAHPLLGEDDLTRDHVLYRLERRDWSRLARSASLNPPPAASRRAPPAEAT